MICKLCQSEIEQYIWHHRQNPKGRVIRRYECECCGTLHPATLLPVRGVISNELIENME